MDTNSELGKKITHKKKTHRILKGLGYLTIFILALMICGGVYEKAAERRDTKNYPPPGVLIDIGGYKLDISCTGTGKPTVIMESGWGDFSASWGWVQPEIAKSARICTYDRAGMGWSESSGEVRTAREFAKELHALLEKAGESGPYILAGHSLGAYTVLVYAHDYPGEVAGLVFIDAQNLPASDAPTYTPAPKPSGTSFLARLARIGIARVFAKPLGAIEDLPENDKQARKARLVTARSIQTFLDEGRGISEGGAQAKSIKTLGSLPIIVLSRGKDKDPQWEASQKEYANLSTNSERIFAENSGHGILFEQPKAIVDVINKMVEKVR